jgi:ABC-2 type transport system ATP-binding protein
MGEEPQESLRSSWGFLMTAEIPMPAAIVCRDLRKRYPAKPTPVEAVNGLDLEVERGECFGLLGPNGAGKTTTIEILEGLLEATSGEVEILGQRWGQGDDRALRQRVGVSLQETKLTEKLTVFETIRLFRAFYDRGLDPKGVLDMVELDEKWHAWVGKLSGGAEAAPGHCHPPGRRSRIALP